ncbi:hypothetical protein N7470_006461 [Penicillium chermesinum]|nr:hypothetical protein N7470_006461 [Penicillium chermesinum]
MTASLSLLEPSENGYPNAGQGYCHSEQPRNASGSVPPDQLPWGSQQGSQHTANTPAPEGPSLHGQAANSYTPAVVVQPSDPTEDPFDHQSAYSQGRLGSDNGAYSPAFSNTTSATSHELIDLDDISSAYSSDGGVQGSGGAVPSSQHVSSQHLLDYLPTPAPVPSTAPERPRIRLSAAEEARQQEQRSETYSIRQINWAASVPNTSPDKNGPCPLLALINALVLRADPASQPPIVRALQAREQISLGLLIEALFEELVTCLGPQDEFPDIEALSQFLTMLHTGMNVNPRLTLEDTESLGTFAQTADLQLYSTFGVPLIHGWLASWTSQPHHAMLRTAQYHEDIQLLPFKKQELEDRVMRGESLSPDEESTMADIHAIQEFVDVENATQLSPFGLTQLTTRLAPGSVSIFFRNDHFSTLYKHPQSQQLFSLVTDAGYANHAEVVWESLVDVTGYNTEFFSGDFRPVSQAPTGTAGQSRSNGSTELAGPRSSSTAANNTLSTASATSTGRLSPQEQADADYAYALSLQFQEEEQREQNQSQPPTRVQSQISPRTSTSDRNRRASAPLGSP